MTRQILTLKPQVTTTPTVESSATLQAGRESTKRSKAASAALIEMLNELVSARQRAFMQMRHGAGYCGTAVALTDGWLRMEQVSVHGTKQSVTVPLILIQINDGSFIAHIHPTDQSNIGVSK